MKQAGLSKQKNKSGSPCKVICHINKMTNRQLTVSAEIESITIYYGKQQVRL